MQIQYPNLRHEMASDFAVFQLLGAQVPPSSFHRPALCRRSALRLRLDHY